MGKHRNVLLITADQLQAACVHDGFVKTPNLDALVADGAVSFRKHYCNSTPCGPARASIHTGCYLMNHCVADNGSPLNTNLTNWAKIAKEHAGYDPVVIGYVDILDLSGDAEKLEDIGTWDGGNLEGMRRLTETDFLGTKEWLEARGYRYKGGPGKYEGWNGHRGNASWMAYRSKEAGERTGFVRPAQYAAEDSDTRVLTDRAIEYFQKKEYSDPGFMMHLSLLKPHPPWSAPYPYNERYSPRSLDGYSSKKTLAEEAETHPWLRLIHEKEGLSAKFGDSTTSKLVSEEELKELKSCYYGLVAELDDNIGRLVAGLKTAGVYDETLIIFTADHGEMLGDHYLMGKLGFYESAYHIPLLIRDPMSLPADAVYTNDKFYTESVDLMPTLLDWAGIPIPSQCDGRSIMPLLKASTQSSQPLSDHEAKSLNTWRTAAHWEVNYSGWGQPDDPETWAGKSFGLVSPDQSSMFVLRSNDYKLVYFCNGLPPLLYNMKEDPGEFENIADREENKAILVQLLHELLDWRATFANATSRELMHMKINYKNQVIYRKRSLL